MTTGPSPSARLDYKKVYHHKLRNKKKYTIASTRDQEGNAKIGLIIYLIRNKKREVFFKVDTLMPDVKYTVSFKADKTHESLMFTYWMKQKSKWVQLNSNDFIH